MAANHLEFAAEVADLPCPLCSKQSVREVVLVNRHGLVLAHGRSCVHCGHLRHRAPRRRRELVHSGVTRSLTVDAA